jgi:hypothetical protein
MGRTHDITISGFDLDRIEAEARQWKHAAENWQHKATEWSRENSKLRSALGTVRFMASEQADIRKVADDALSNNVMSQPEPSTPKTTSGQAEGLAR